MLMPKRKTRANYRMVDEADPQFARFWNAYPKRVAKKEARKAWATLNPDPVVVEAMLFALAWQVPLHRWAGEKYSYAPYPASWLNDARWEDDPPPQVQPRAMSEGAAMVFDTLRMKP